MTEEMVEIPVNIITWDIIRAQRDQFILEAERCYNFDSPESLRKLWMDYKQELRDIPQAYADLDDLRLIQWPQTPTSHFQTLYLSRFSPYI